MDLNKLKRALKNVLLNNLQIRFYSAKYEYEIPETYRNAFYLANSSLVNTTNWFVHNALAVFYQEVINKLMAEGCNNYSEAERQVSSTINILEPCNNFIDIQFPVARDNGQYEIYRGFRAQHGVYINKSPCLGGLRLCSKIEKSDIKALASLSTYKYACMGIDLTGAHGGILVSTKDLNEGEIQRVVASYATQLTKKGFCGESTDIFEPDMNCGSDSMKYIIASNSKVTGRAGNACAMGKPVSFGGVRNCEKSAAQGICVGLDFFLQNFDVMQKIGLEVGWSNKTFILQGLGKIGSYVGTYLEYGGIKCIGIVEHDCYIYNPKGVSVREAAKYKTKNGTLDGFQSLTKYNAPSTVLTADCDILVLAATQKSLSYYIVDKVQAKIVIEAANGPISPSVHKMLLGRNKLVLPDIYINSGSSIASYFEYLNNMQHLPKEYTAGLCLNDKFENLLKLSKTTIQGNDYGGNAFKQKIMLDKSEKNVATGIIENLMRQTAKDIMKTAKLYNLGLDLRTAAYINALKKLFWAAHKNLKRQ